LTRRELIAKLTIKLSHFSERDVALAVKRIIVCGSRSAELTGYESTKPS
jgi:hypothetical protein